ncbi:MAG: hypothetical protein Q4G03_11550, partial [Planctomycetia bacterium]|nr:hypothetical protein [Planctomycetia bacterium]
MAKHNPFSIFRRNQKAWMAGLTLFTMFSFIALGSMLQCVGTRNSGGEQRFVGDVAKTQKFGKLDYNTFLIIRQDLFRLQAFLQSLTQQAGALGAIPSAELAELNAEVTIAASDAEIIVDRWLIGKYADAMKLGADDSAALQYLQILIQVTQQEKNESVTRTLPSDAITNSMRAAGLNETSLKDLLKRQIAYQRVIREFDGGRRTVPEFYYTLMMAQYGMLQLSPAQLGYGYAGPQPSPAQMLRGYEALNRLIKTRVVTFKAEDYVDLVSDPSEEEARAYYEQYKDVVFSSASNRPGFTQPTKLALQVVRADVTEEILNAITSEEVEKYYEEHKEDFRNPQHAAASAATEETPAQNAVSLGDDAPSLDAIPEDALNALSDDVENAVDPAETAAETAAENATEAVENAAQDAVDAAQDAAEEAVDSATDAVENAAEAV